jgi:hypothetical protein
VATGPGSADNGVVGSPLVVEADVVVGLVSTAVTTPLREPASVAFGGTSSVFAGLSASSVTGAATALSVTGSAAGSDCAGDSTGCLAAGRRHRKKPASRPIATPATR